MIQHFKTSILKKLAFFLLPVSMGFGQMVLDPTFDGDGKVTTPIVAGLNSVYDIAIQSDGKIVAVGYALAGVNYDVAVARYQTNGSLDSTFNSVGFDILDLGSNDDIAYSVAIQADGKIVVAGSAGNGSNTDFLLLRFNTNGTLDNSFDTDGIVTTTFDISYETAYDVAIQSDGKIVAAGSAFIDTVYNFAVARYKTDGSLDPVFGSGGKATTLLTNSDEARTMAIQTDGKIVLAGTTLQPDFSIAFGVARFRANGTLDTTFGGTGKVVTNVTTYSEYAQAMAIQSDGKIVVAGKGTPVGPEMFAVVRYNTNGTLDNGWNGTGMVTTAFGTTWDEARAVIIQPDGKVIAGGLATVGGQRFAMARYNTDGTLDPAFGTGGKLTTSFGSSASIWAMQQQADLKIVTAGYTGSAANYDFGLIRYTDGLGAISEVNILNHSLMVYPNPVNQYITIQYDLSEVHEITIELLGLDGRIITTFLANQKQDPGTHQQSILLPENLASGSYFIVISSPKGAACAKLVKE